MKACEYTGCNAPHAECSGACMTHSMFSSRARPCLPLHRVDTSQLPDERAAMVAGNTDELPIDFAGDEPIRWIQAAAGYVALLFVVLSAAAFAGYFS